MIRQLRIRILCWSLNRRVRKFQAKLQRMTDERRESFAVRDFAKRRAGRAEACAEGVGVVRRGKVICSTTKGPVEVPATLSAHLATHRDLVNGEYRRGGGVGWTVTHIASGFAMEWCDTQREASAFVQWAEREHGDELAVLAALKFGKGPGKRGKIGTASKRLHAARAEYRKRQQP